MSRMCESLPAGLGFPVGTVVGVAIAGVIVVVLVVGSGLLLCMCCRLGPFKGMTSFSVITIQLNKGSS